MRLGSRDIMGDVVCLGLGGITVLIAFIIYEQHLDAARRLRDWPRADARVTLVERLTRVGKKPSDDDGWQTTVRFQAAGGRSAEGLLFERGYEPGNTVAVRYDPAAPYMPHGPSYNREVYAEGSLANDARAWPKVAVAAAVLVAGLGLAGFGGRRLYRRWADVGGRPPIAGAPAGPRVAGPVVAGFGPGPMPPPPRAPPRPAGGEWVPPAGLVSHDGKAVAAGADFFVPPPAEIGDVVSAHTTLRRGQEPVPVPLRVGLISACVLLPAAASWWVFQEKHSIEFIEAVVISSALVFGFGTALAIRATRFSHAVTYVGTHGVWAFRLKGSRHKRVAAGGVLFCHAADLLASLVRSGHLGVLNFDFVWADPAGRPIHQIEGTCWLAPRPANPYHYAVAAENAWSAYRFDALAPYLRQAGYLQFDFASGSDWVRVGPGFLEFRGAGTVERCEAADVRSLALADGRFSVVHKDASWFGRRGTYSFDYRDLRNAAVFTLAVTRLVGWKG